MNVTPKLPMKAADSPDKVSPNFAELSKSSDEKYGENMNSKTPIKRMVKRTMALSSKRKVSLDALSMLDNFEFQLLLGRSVRGLLADNLV